MVHFNFQKVRSGKVLVQVGEAGAQGRHLWPEDSFYGQIEDCPWKVEVQEALYLSPVYTPNGRPC